MAKSSTVGLRDHLVALCQVRGGGGETPHLADVRAVLAPVTSERSRDAFLRYTSSNWPDAWRRSSAAPVQARGFWPWVNRHPLLTLIGLVIALILLVSAWQAVLALAVVIGAVWLIITVVRKLTTHGSPATVPPVNPWPFGAERAGGYGELAGESTLLRPEAELLGVAVLLVEQVKASPTVADPLVDTGYLLPQVDDSLQSISHQCHRIWSIRSSIESPESSSEVGRALNAAIKDRMTRVGAHWRAVLDNVSQLADLAATLDDYGRVLRDQHRHQRMMADPEQFGVGPIADPRRDQLQEMNANLAAQVGFINDTARRVASVDLH